MDRYRCRRLPPSTTTLGDPANGRPNPSPSTTTFETLRCTDPGTDVDPGDGPPPSVGWDSFAHTVIRRFSRAGTLQFEAFLARAGKPEVFLELSEWGWGGGSRVGGWVPRPGAGAKNVKVNSKLL